MNKTFATAINCIDGRVQEPVVKYIKEKFNVDYVDMITEPGVNKIVADNTNTSVVGSIRKKVTFSVTGHDSKTIAVIGHHECIGNPASEEEQEEHLSRAVEIIEEWELPVETIVGLWVDSESKVIKKTGKKI